MLALAAAIAIAGCASDRAPHPPKAPITKDSRRVLVVFNGASPGSKELADYYVARRGIPDGNVVRIDCAGAEDIAEKDYRDRIEDPVRQGLSRSRNVIDFIVLMRGVPLRIKGAEGYSVDAWLAVEKLTMPPIRTLTKNALEQCLNPYFGSTEPFSSARYGFYLVTRLDGYTVEDCRALVDRSLAARRERGPFLLDEAANRKTESYGMVQAGLERAAAALSGKGLSVQLDRTSEFVAPTGELAGYASWGSNDAAFDPERYRQLRFKPGALCETFVSTSGRTFRPTQGGQSLIADLIAQGVTGVKGYVSEPYTFALAKPDILFDRYTSGRNLAESFYAASQFLKWKDVVIGDPLCAPFRP